MDDHIEISKENISQWEYRFPTNPNAPKPPIREKGKHGKLLQQELHDAVNSIIVMRESVGVEVDSLLVLEISSDTLEPDIDLLQNKLHLSIVEEVMDKNGNSKLVVQFDESDRIADFEYERQLYEQNSQEVGLLTSIQREKVFSCISNIRPVSIKDRTGSRLLSIVENNQLPDGLFIVDIDVWYTGKISDKNIIEAKVRSALGTGDSCLLGDFFVIPNMLLGRAKVNRYTLEVLRKLDLIALVDFPIGNICYEHSEMYSSSFFPKLSNTLEKNAPMACVLDSGVFSGNPLLSSVIIGEEDFNLQEETTSDMNGHGTGVAGIVVYGDLSNFDNRQKAFTPLVQILNGKVMHNEHMPSGETTAYPLEKRPEQIIEETIRYFHSEYNCRIYNLSSGNVDHVYNGGRQMTWASLLDELIRELDIVIVVSAGNVSKPEIPFFSNRNDLMAKCRDNLLSQKHRIIDPATTALGITVGSITRFEEPESIPLRPVPISVGKKDYPSVFTRSGEGVNGAIKPDFVDYGGNFAIRQPHSSLTTWCENRLLLEPTLNYTNEGVFKGWCGTSFAAPHVTHIAARLERALQQQTGMMPSSNLIRSLLASSASFTQNDWLNGINPPGFTNGNQRQPQSWRMQIVGYGKVNECTLFSDRNHVTLFTEDSLDLRQIHMYKIPVPTEFLKLKTNKKITIGFAFNPPTRLSRKSYIANSLWFEVFRRIDIELLLKIKGREINPNSNQYDVENFIENFSRKHGAPFFPGYTEVKNSTLQQRTWEASAQGGANLLWDNNEPYIYVLVTGKVKFKHPFEMDPQPYALSVTFSYENESDIQLRQKLLNKVTLKQREQIRSRTQVRV